MDTKAKQLINELDIKTEQTWSMLAAVAEEQGDHVYAIGCYGRLVRLCPSHPLAVEGIKRNCTRIQSSQKVIEMLTALLTALDTTPKTAEVGKMWGLLAHYLLMEKQLDAAHQAYQNAISIMQNPTDPALWLGIGVMMFWHNSSEQALTALNRALVVDPQFHDANQVHYFLGMIYKRQLKRVLALESFSKIQQNPPSPLTPTDILFEIGQVHELHNQFREARSTYEEVLQKTDQCPRVKAQLAWLLAKQGQPRHLEQAKNLLIEATSQGAGTNTLAWVMLGRVQAMSNNFADAFEAFRLALIAAPTNAVVWCELGSLYFTTGQLDDCLLAYKRAIQLNPRMGEAWYNRGVVFEKQGLLSDAVSSLRRAVEVNSHPHANKRLTRASRWLARAHQHSTQPTDSGGNMPEPMFVDLTNPLINTRDVPMKELVFTPHAHFSSTGAITATSLR